MRRVQDKAKTQEAATTQLVVYCILNVLILSQTYCMITHIIASYLLYT